MKRPFSKLAVPIVSVLLFGSSAAQAADPTKAECLAASEASLKLANDHKVRAERSALLICAAASCPAVIRKECVDRVADVNVQIPTVLIDAKGPSGGDLSAVHVTMDGEVLTDKLDGTALAVDPGEHTFSFETAGQPPITRKLLIQEAQKDRRELVTFGTPSAATGSGATTGSAATMGSPLPPTAKAGMGAQKIAALAVGGVGVVGLGLGAILGAVALSQKSAAETACPGAMCATQAGSDKWSSAASTGNVSTVGLIVGAVALAGGAVLWLTAPRATSGPAPQVGVAPGSLQLRASW